MADSANWQLPLCTVNRGSEFTHMQSGPVRYHNKMHLLDSTCDRKLMATAEKRSIFFLLRLCATARFKDFPLKRDRADLEKERD